jgi:hypothetical protein
MGSLGADRQEIKPGLIQRWVGSVGVDAIPSPNKGREGDTPDRGRGKSV